MARRPNSVSGVQCSWPCGQGIDGHAIGLLPQGIDRTPERETSGSSLEAVFGLCALVRAALVRAALVRAKHLELDIQRHTDI